MFTQTVDCLGISTPFMCGMLEKRCVMRWRRQCGLGVKARSRDVGGAATEQFRTCVHCLCVQGFLGVSFGKRRQARGFVRSLVCIAVRNEPSGGNPADPGSNVRVTDVGRRGEPYWVETLRDLPFTIDRCVACGTRPREHDTSL